MEPNIEFHSVFRLTDYNIAINKADIIVFLVAHKEFLNMDIPDEKLLLDFCGVKKLFKK